MKPSMIGRLIFIIIVVNLFSACESEEEADARKMEAYRSCVDSAVSRAKQACAMDPCDVGCRLMNTDNYSYAVNCINACKTKSAAEKQQVCENAAGSVEVNARLECPI